MQSREEFFRWLDPDAEVARERFERIQLRLVKFFTWNGCFEPLDCVEETILRVLVALAKKTDIENPEAYILGVARNVQRECQRKRRWLRSLVDVVEVDPVAPRSAPDCETREILESCLGWLTAAERQLIRDHHENGESIAQIADRLRASVSAVALRLFKARHKLRVCLERKSA